MAAQNCDPKDVALKSFFLGPQAENAEWVIRQMDLLLKGWFTWRRSLFPEDGPAISSQDQNSVEFGKRRSDTEKALEELARRFEAEMPKFSPRYIGHMFSEISLPALFGHIVTLLHNPNNMSGESSRVGVKIENEAVSELLQLVGFDPGEGAGHFTSGGSIAGLEAMVRARARFLSGKGSESKDSPIILVPGNRHYSWEKNSRIIGLPASSFELIDLDQHGRLDIEDLKRRCENRPVFMVVSVAGTTEMGSIDPVDQVQDALDEINAHRDRPIWHHVDAAYGGFFAALGALKARQVLGDSAAAALKAMGRADSVTLDPHKLGYVPYSSGAILVRRKVDYALSLASVVHGVPYVQFDYESDRGPFTIEGSRSAAGAAATWMTARTVGFNPEGYGRILTRTISARLKLAAALESSGLPVRVAPSSDTNIVCLAAAGPGQKLSEVNARTERVAEAFSPEAKAGFIVSKTVLDEKVYGRYIDRFVSLWGGTADCDHLSLVRICLMNPFFDSVQTRVSYCAEFVNALSSFFKQDEKH